MQGGRVQPPPVLLLHPWDPQLFPLGLSGNPAPVTNVACAHRRACHVAARPALQSRGSQVGR